MIVVKNPDEKKYSEISQAVLSNDGYCPCMTTKTLDTKCMCKDFREQTQPGPCHCGRYLKKDNIEGEEE